MKRRVAIARAIAFDSPLVLLDEPFTGLDSQTRARTASFILRHTPQSILVMVTHDPEEAALLNAEVRTLDGLLNPPG
jgi:ABC-type nitrate/sulfonate/bicarbonate transport system ATPase subunit